MKKMRGWVRRGLMAGAAAMLLLTACGGGGREESAAAGEGSAAASGGSTEAGEEGSVMAEESSAVSEGSSFASEIGSAMAGESSAAAEGSSALREESSAVDEGSSAPAGKEGSSLAAESSGEAGTAEEAVSGKGNAAGKSAAAVEPFFPIEEDGLEEKVASYLDGMTLEEKVAQLFIVTLEVLTGSEEALTVAGEDFAAAFDRLPVGGFIFMGDNLVDGEQTGALLSAVQECSRERLGLPAFACVDEEGGTVTRISGTGKFRVPTIGDMARIGKKNDPDRAYDTGVKIGTYLRELGFNVDFAPVADVLTNPDNQVVKLRSFGNDPNVVANMAASVAAGLASQHILGTYKHFPGHGATAADTHEGYAYTERTKEQLFAKELVPFADGIARGIPFIMVAHISLPNVTGDDTPASLSPVIVDGILRGEMGYDGIVVTDALDMGAIVQEYSSAETAVKALGAGADILLAPEDFTEAWQGVLSAVSDGTLPEERIDESVKRVLRVKLGLLSADE